MFSKKSQNIKFMNKIVWTDEKKVEMDIKKMFKLYVDVKRSGENRD